jgi:hypothetical protein
MKSFHDFNIVGIQVDLEQCMATLFLTEPAEFDKKHTKKRKLVFKDIKKIFVDGLTLQNVIFDIYVFTRREDSFEYKRACALLDISSVDGSVFDNFVSMIFIEASVGAEVACLISGYPDLLLEDV